MTVTNPYAPVRTNGDGILTAFGFTFKIFDETDLQVFLVDDATNTPVLQTLTTHYTVVIDTLNDGGTVNMVTPPSAIEDLLITRVISLTQPTNLPNRGSVRESQLENEYDRSRMIDQQISEQSDRVITISVAAATASPGLDLELTDSPVAGRGLVWNATADGLVNSDLDLNAIAASVAAAAASEAAAAASASAASASETAAAASAAQAAASVSTIGLIPDEQSTPDNTVYVTAGTYQHPGNGLSAVDVADNFASAITFAVVTADSRIDLLVADGDGTPSVIQGVQSSSPVAPQHPIGFLPIAEVTVDETVTVVVNTADIRDVRPIISGYAQAEGLLSGLLFWCEWTVPNATSGTAPRNEVDLETYTLIGGNTIATSNPVTAVLGDYVETNDNNLTFTLSGTPAISDTLGHSLVGWIDADSAQWEFGAQSDGGDIMHIKRQGSNYQITIGAGGLVDMGIAVSADGTWEHVALVLDKDGDFTFYLDGVVAGSGSGTLVASTTLSNVRYRETGGGGTNVVRGESSAYFNATLNSTQIAALYSGGSGRLYNSLS